MVVLWISNIVFPEAESKLNGSGVLKTGGGWIVSAAEELIKHDAIDLYVAALSPKVKKLTLIRGERIIYYLLPFGRGNSRVNHEYDSYWRLINSEVKPDVVHLYGTEFSHGLSYLTTCETDNVCVSIQGLIEACSDYYYSGLSKYEILRSSTIHSVIKGGIIHGRKNYKRRGLIEKEIIKRAGHIIGRTSWDHQRIWAINPKAHYHYCGEILRPVFYNSPKWTYEKCQPHSIFMSQASYPIKGLHMLLRALPLLLQHYPDTRLKVAGIDITKTNTMRDWLKFSDYGLILRRLINKEELRNVVTFTGPLDAEEMRNEYLNCNVFVCPSSIENSPNSIGEAQVLGVPVVASYAGGIPDMMKGDEEHMYRFEEIEMMVYKICDIFDKGSRVDTNPMRKEALSRHDPIKNNCDLLSVYRLIVSD